MSNTAARIEVQGLVTFRNRMGGYLFWDLDDGSSASLYDSSRPPVPRVVVRRSTVGEIRFDECAKVGICGWVIVRGHVTHEATGTFLNAEEVDVLPGPIGGGVEL